MHYAAHNKIKCAISALVISKDGVVLCSTVKEFVYGLNTELLAVGLCSYRLPGEFSPIVTVLVWIQFESIQYLDSPVNNAEVISMTVAVVNGC